MIIYIQKTSYGTLTKVCKVSPSGPNTTKSDFIVLLQVNEISLTINEFYQPLMISLKVNNYY